MLETYIIARDKFLKKNGKMYPAYANFCVVPFYDESLYMDYLNKVSFWNNTNFYGFDLSGLSNNALEEKFRQPVIEYYDYRTHIAKEYKIKIDFRNISLEEFKTINYNCSFKINKVGVLHGLSFWFEAHFLGPQKNVTLNTGPNAVPTHWYQMRFLLRNPIGVNPGQISSLI